MKTFSFKKFPFYTALILILVSARLSLLASDTNLPAPASVQINFDRDIHPILETSCLRCHGSQKPKSHFRLDYREGALAGGDNNTNDIVPGDSGNSLLIAYVARQVPDMEMPPTGKGNPLTPQQISLLRAWIDQGANWNTTNQPSPLDLIFEPTVRDFIVNGNQQEFRELEGTREGISGGVQNFSSTAQIGPDEKISLEGYAIAPDQDYHVRLALDRADVSFIHAGFDQWRKYYATDGGYDPSVFPSQFNLDNNLYVDNGNAWVDFGLNLPRWPEIVFGYQVQYRKGDESTLDWGYANGKNIYPATQSLDEQTHTIKLDIKANLNDWLFENIARIDYYNAQNEGAEAAILFGGTSPDNFITTRDNYRQVQGMDTFTLQKQLFDWWFLDGGFYYSKLTGNDYFSQTNAIPSFSSITVLTSQEITLNRQSEIFSFANLFSPLSYLTFSLGTQNEWTRETSFSEGIPDLELGGAVNVPVNSSLDELKASQSANFRFTKIPFTIISGDVQFSEDYYDINQTEGADGADLQHQAAANNFRYDAKTGFSTSPWPAVDLTVQVERQSSDTEYDQLVDQFGDLFIDVSGPTNGYPGFILNRTIISDQFETKLDLRPAVWLKTTLTYQIADTDYSSKTDPAYDPFLGEIVSEGGSIADGHYNLQTYGISATLTPFRRLYFYGAFTYSYSQVVTADNGDPSIAPYQGNIFTVNGMATCLLNPKTSLQLSYVFSSADYSQNNAVAGVPAGLDYQHHNLIVGLTRKLTKNLSGALNYEYALYKEPSTANANNYSANAIMASFTYRWP